MTFYHNTKSFKHSCTPARGDLRFFFSPLHGKTFDSESLRLQGQKFSTIAQLCKRVLIDRRPYYDIRYPSDSLNLTLPEHQFLNAIRINLLERAPELANLAPARVHRPKSSWVLGALGFSKSSLKKGLNRVFHKVPEDYIPPSFHTRRNENAICPRDPAHFCSAYQWVACSTVPTSFRSITLEFLNRTLTSPRKLHRMGVSDPPPLNCPLNNELADLDHVIITCAIPESLLAVLNLFLSHQPNLPGNISQEWFAFMWRIDNIDSEIQTQLFLLSAACKVIAHKAHCNPSFSMLSVNHCHAKILSIIKLALDAANTTKAPSKIINLLHNWTFDNFLAIRYAIYEVFRSVNVSL